ncbi:MAG: FAD-binding oxidoreductase [Pseudomonadota bacterium]
MRIVIIGGGIMGASVAWWLSRGENRPHVTVLERAPDLASSATMLSAASIRQQFSLAENVRLSRFGWDFLSNATETLGEDVGLRRRGYLILASEQGADALRDSVAIQHAEGAQTRLLDPAALTAQFPWIAADGIALAALGVDEGWFDPASLHRGFKRGAQAAGVVWRAGEASALQHRSGQIAAVQTDDGVSIPADLVVNAAGPRGGAVAAMAGIAMPVRPDIRTVFRLTSPNAQLIRQASPLTVDISGVWMRPEGDGFISGAASAVQPADPWALEPDWALFEDMIWPALAARIPAFERLRMAGAWAGPYDWNAVDQNGLIGFHPGCSNLCHICGFSGHGLQQAPAAGRAVAELVLTGAYRSIDLSALGADRLAEGREMREQAII